MAIAIVRLRGRVGINKKIEDTMKMLKLRTSYNVVIVQDNPHYNGMLQKIKDYTTFGTITKENFEKILFKWGRTEGNKKVTPEYLKEKKISVEELLEGKKKFKDIGIKQPFRLHPARKGLKSIKKPFTMKGDLGNRGDKINELLERMI